LCQTVTSPIPARWKVILVFRFFQHPSILDGSIDQVED
jgi:hypothetical protein